MGDACPWLRLPGSAYTRYYPFYLFGDGHDSELSRSQRRLRPLQSGRGWRRQIADFSGGFEVSRLAWSSRPCAPCTRFSALASVLTPAVPRATLLVRTRVVLLGLHVSTPSPPTPPRQRRRPSSRSPPRAVCVCPTLRAALPRPPHPLAAQAGGGPLAARAGGGPLAAARQRPPAWLAGIARTRARSSDPGS